MIYQVFWHYWLEQLMIRDFFFTKLWKSSFVEFLQPSLNMGLFHHLATMEWVVPVIRTNKNWLYEIWWSSDDFVRRIMICGALLTPTPCSCFFEFFFNKYKLAHVYNWLQVIAWSLWPVWIIGCYFFGLVANRIMPVWCSEPVRWLSWIHKKLLGFIWSKLGVPLVYNS